MHNTINLNIKHFEKFTKLRNQNKNQMPQEVQNKRYRDMVETKKDSGKGINRDNKRYNKPTTEMKEKGGERGGKPLPFHTHTLNLC